MLREQNIEPEIINYLENPPDAATIETLLTQLGLKPRELMRKKEKEYKVLGLADDELSRAELIAAMAAHPRLIERPIVVGPNGTVMGRPRERVLEVL